MNTTYLPSIIKQFQYYKMLGDKTIERLSEEEVFWQYNKESNSIAIIVKHLWGNMLSRWTNFLTEDGEKTWRNRDGEFEADIQNKAELLEKWEAGWACLFEAIRFLTAEQLEDLIYIRNMGHTVTEAINRQLAHYAYHVGQMVYLGRMIKGKDWESLSIAKGQSVSYNQKKFASPKGKRHFTDEFLEK